MRHVNSPLRLEAGSSGSHARAPPYLWYLPSLSPEVQLCTSVMQATEDFMVHLLEDCNLCAIHAKRVTISAYPGSHACPMKPACTGSTNPAQCAKHTRHTQSAERSQPHSLRPQPYMPRRLLKSSGG